MNFRGWEISTGEMGNFQSALTTQPAKESIQVKQSATGDVFDRIQQTYDSNRSQSIRDI
jgi:hypothetical protein